MNTYSETVIPIIKRTRDITLPFFGKVEALKYKTEGEYDVVTKIDEEVEQFLKEELAKFYPDIAFVGEETGGDRTAKKYWIVDPVDGTLLYIRGLPFCTTMLALVENDEVIFSVIYDFVAGVVYHAEKGKGAYKDGVQIHVSKRAPSKSFICYETHLDKQKNLDIFIKLREFLVLFKVVCSGYEFAMIAEGKVEGKVCFDPWGKDYDFAPGSLLVTEAGGIVTNLYKTTYSISEYDFIAATPELHEKLTKGPDAIFPIR